MTERSRRSTTRALSRAGSGASTVPVTDAPAARPDGRPSATSRPRTLAPAVARQEHRPNGRTPVVGPAATGTVTATAPGTPVRQRGTAAPGTPVRQRGTAAPGTPVRQRGTAARATTSSAARTDRTAAPATPTGRPAGAAPPARRPDVWDQRVAGALALLRRRITGQYEVDEFGFDREFTEAFIYPFLRPLYRRYFRVECTGVENLPRRGAALVVANHSGTVPVDAMMLSLAIHDETPDRRYLRLLGADLVFRVPVLSELARRAGSTLACNPDVERLLRNGELVGVFPEGFKGVGKPYRDRYRLQRFGRGGFVSAALRTGTPIIPVSIVGAEEIYPIVGNIRPLARIAGLPYFPVTPLFPWFGPLGMLPLPSKWLIEFGQPIDTSHYGEDREDPIVIFDLADQVRETIAHTLRGLLRRRPDPFA